MQEITICLTSCGRWELLEKTLNSFFSLNTYPIKEFFITDDSGNTTKCIEFEEKYKQYNVKFICNVTKRGQSASIDEMYSRVSTDYIFHCEDDWYFQGNPNFIEESIKILDNDAEVGQVWIRHLTDHGHPLENTKWLGPLSYRMLSTKFIDWWCGFSWNPGVRRLSDYKKMFPNGFSEFKEEILCNNHAATQGYRAASLMHTSCFHIGYGEHTKDYKW